MSQVVHADAGDNDTKRLHTFFKLSSNWGPQFSLTTYIPILIFFFICHIETLLLLYLREQSFLKKTHHKSL